MTTFPVSGESGSRYTPSEGWHDAVCAQYRDRGVSPKYGNPLGELMFEVAEVDEEGKRRISSMLFNQSWGSEGKPSKLRTFVRDWLGRKATTNEALGAMHIEDLEGEPAYVHVIHKPKADGDGVWARIDKVSEPRNRELALSEDYQRVDDQPLGGASEQPEASQYVPAAQYAPAGQELPW